MDGDKLESTTFLFSRSTPGTTSHTSTCLRSDRNSANCCFQQGEERYKCLCSPSCRSLASWGSCGASASCPACTRSRPPSPCRSTPSFSTALWCYSSSTPSRPATINLASGSLSCWLVQFIIHTCLVGFWKKCQS